MPKKVIIVGYFQEVIELCELCNIEIVGVIDNNDSETFNNSTIPILGTDAEAEVLFSKFGRIPLLLTPDSPSVRKKLANYYSNIGYKFLTVISPNATISRTAKIGEGVFIQSGVNVSANVEISDFVRLKTNANVMHDCEIDTFSTVAPNAVLLGKVRVYTEAYIGSNATVLPGCTIGNNAMVGAGSVVTKNVDNNTVVVGNPSKFFKNN